MEGSGVIIELGPDAKEFNVGDEVIVSMSLGTHADQMIVYENQCIRKPNILTHIEAAGLLVGFCTAYHGKNLRSRNL